MVARTRSTLTLPYREGVVNATGSINTTISGVFEQSGEATMDDIVTPGYQQLIARGAIINNPCSYGKEEHTTVGSGTGSYDPEDGSPGYRLTGSLTRYRQSNALYASLDPIEGSASEAQFYALSNVDRTPFAFGEDLAEIGQTIRFIRDPLGSLRNLSRGFKGDVSQLLRKKKQKARYSKAEWAERRALAVADVWLEYRFAAMPLVRSVHDAFRSISYVDDRPVRLTARGKSGGQVSASETRTMTHSNGTTTFDFDVKTTRNVRYRSSILYQIDNPVKDWRYTFGLRTQDLPETAWQVVPYSFMVDRLVNVSAAIRGLTVLANPKLEILAASTVTHDDLSTTWRHNGQDADGWTASVSGETAKRSNFTYKRDIWTPSMSDTVPPVTPGNLVNDVTKTADLIALVLKNFR